VDCHNRGYQLGCC